MKKTSLLTTSLMSMLMLMSGSLFAQQQLLPSNVLVPPSPTPTPLPPTPVPVVAPATVAPTSAPAVTTPAPITPSTNSDTIPTTPPANASQKFSGQGPSNTHPFTMKDRWEVDWYSAGPLTITMGHLDGKQDETVAQQSGPGPSHGSSFEPIGGEYFLKITGSGNWTVWTMQLGDSGSTLATNPVAPTQSPMVAPPVSPISTPTDLNYFQGSIVIIAGEAATGTGFLVKRPEGTCVITNQHVIWSNQNLSFQTMDGKKLVVTSLVGASDRDLAIFGVKDDDGKLPVVATASDVGATVRPQDDTVIPGNSQGAMVVTNTPGKVLAVGPVRLEVSNPIYPGNSGGPVMDLRLRQAVGVITEAEKSDTDGFVNKNSLADKNSSIAAVRYFSLRFDNVPSWQTMDLQLFYRQTFFIDSFHKQTLELISIYKAFTKGDDSHDDSGISTTLYTENPRLVDLARTTHGQELALALESISKEGVGQMVPGNFYLYNQQRAKDELEVRNDVIDAFKEATESWLKTSLEN